VEFDKPKRVQRVAINEAVASRVQKFEFQYREANHWRTIFSGTTLGERFERKIDPVSAKEFRLNILEATDGPTISEIALTE